MKPGQDRFNCLKRIIGAVDENFSDLIRILGKLEFEVCKEFRVLSIYV